MTVIPFSLSLLLVELELELIQTQMAQKPILLAVVYARALTTQFSHPENAFLPHRTSYLRQKYA
jgi:hypothetical protein